MKKYVSNLSFCLFLYKHRVHNRERMLSTGSSMAFRDSEAFRDIHCKLDTFHANMKIPHIIFHGPCGSGKKTIVLQFLQKIYFYDRHKIKNNVMFVNCSHGKGIKFIREDLKFFAKTNVQTNTGVLFKTIVLYNADSLTNDAQSALRRCIELFSGNTRFFIVVERKQKLLNPILSRFCEIYVPEHLHPETDQAVNLHKERICANFNISALHAPIKNFVRDDLQSLCEMSKRNEITHRVLVDHAEEWVDRAASCSQLMQCLMESRENSWSIACFSEEDIVQAHVCFYKIRSEYRCEKLLILFMLDYLFLRKNTDVGSVLFL